MKVGVERLPDITLAFLSPFSHVLHHHLELEVAPLWFISNSTYIQTMCPRKRRSRMPCETNETGDIESHTGTQGGYIR